MRRLLRRVVAAAVGLVAIGGLYAAEPAAGPGPADRRAVMVRAEADLARGDAVAAAAGFERAGAMAHAADGEMGVVRAWLQQGEYRRALAFCAHVAGAHLDAPEAAVLYAWLLRLGTQTKESDRVLGEALRRAPADPVVVRAASALATPLPVADGPLLEGPHRLAPVGDPLPAGRVVSSGVLLDGGERALVPLTPAASRPGSRLWVRNGLGQSSEATIAAASGTPGAAGAPVQVLRLVRPLPADRMGTPSTRPSYAGSLAFVAEFAESDSSRPAWPWLRSGFLGSPRLAGPLSRLGVEVAGGMLGGPVFDGAGRVTGMALRGLDGQALFLPLAGWPEEAAPSDAGRPVAGPLAADAVYELAMRRTLQVIAAP